MTTGDAFAIGPRQTVDVIAHPTLGEVRAVYGNGPRAFVASDGTATPFKRCGRGWNQERGMLLSVTEADGRRERYPIKHCGDTHRRAWSAPFGEGWLVSLASNGEERLARERFDGDDGRVTSFAWVKAEIIGTVAYRALSKRKQDTTEMTDEDRRWIRFADRDGSALVFRMDGAPPTAAETPIARASGTMAQLSFGGVR